MKRNDQPTPQPTPSVGEIYTTASQHAHELHCTGCREQTAARAAFTAENGASMARRDRLTLDARTVHTPAVTA